MHKAVAIVDRILAIDRFSQVLAIDGLSPGVFSGCLQLALTKPHLVVVLNVVLNYCDTFLTVSLRFESGIYFTFITMYGKKTD